MRDFALFTAVRSFLEPWLTSTGPSAQMLEGYAGRVPFTPNGFVIAVYKVAEVRYGFPERREVYNPETQEFDFIEATFIETTLQFSGIGPAPNATEPGERVGDMLKRAAFGLQTDAARQAFRAVGLSILRVRDFRVVYAKGDDGQNEQTPTFDAVFVHRDEIRTTTPLVNSREVIITNV